MVEPDAPVTWCFASPFLCSRTQMLVTATAAHSPHVRAAQSRGHRPHHAAQAGSSQDHACVCRYMPWCLHGGDIHFLTPFSKCVPVTKQHRTPLGDLSPSFSPENRRQDPWGPSQSKDRGTRPRPVTVLPLQVTGCGDQSQVMASVHPGRWSIRNTQ